MSEQTLDLEAMVAQFNRLISELLRGTMSRNTFRPWEIEILLDIEACDLRDANRREILRRYQKAVRKHVDQGGETLLKLSQYLDRNRAKRNGSITAPAAS